MTPRSEVRLEDWQGEDLSGRSHEEVDFVELDLTGASVVVFRHAGHGRVNLVYRRNDGHIGWIDPPAIETKGTH